MLGSSTRGGAAAAAEVVVPLPLFPPSPPPPAFLGDCAKGELGGYLSGCLFRARICCRAEPRRLKLKGWVPSDSERCGPGNHNRVSFLLFPGWLARRGSTGFAPPHPCVRQRGGADAECVCVFICLSVVKEERTRSLGTPASVLSYSRMGGRDRG